MTSCWAFCMAYQEEAIIPFWARHYATFCDRLIIYVDTGTTDQTREVASREGAEVRSFSSGGSLNDLAMVDFAQERYKLVARGHADWVIWVDADEFLYHPRIGERLSELRAAGVTYPHVAGYTMVADAPPTGPGQIYDEIRMGLPSTEYGKVCVFDPALDVVWAPGKHTATVTGNAVRDDRSDPLKLLHYRYLGEEWFVARNARNFARVDERNRSMQHGKETYPGYEGIYSPAWFAEQRGGAVDVITEGVLE